MALLRPSDSIPAIGGLLQRLTLIISFTWLAALALHLRRQLPAAPEPGR